VLCLPQLQFKTNGFLIPLVQYLILNSSPNDLQNNRILGSNGRSQWPLGLRHEPSPPAQTLRSLVRIPHEAWTSVCVYSVFMLSCVQVAALRRADPPSKESYRLCKGL
jgi:hypothetical protein